MGLGSTEVQQGLYWSNIMKLPRVHLCYAEVCSELWESERARLWVQLVTSRDIRHLVYLGLHMYCVLDGTFIGHRLVIQPYGTGMLGTRSIPDSQSPTGL